MRHEHSKAERFRQLRLFKGDGAAEGRFQGERFAGRDVVANEDFKLTVDLLPDGQRDRAVGSAVQICRAVVGVENPIRELPQGEDRGFSGAGRTGDDRHSRRRHYPPKSRSEPSRISGGSSEFRSFPSLSMSPIA